MTKPRRDADDFVRDMKAKQQHSTPGDTERKDRIAANASEALRRLKSGQTYEDWRAIGQQLMVITEEVLNDLGLDAWDKDDKKLVKEFTRRFEGWEASVSNAKPITKQERWALRQLMTEPKYHEFYTVELAGPEQRKTNHPGKIIEKYNHKHPDPNKPKKERKPSDLLSPALTEKNKVIEQRDARIGELEEEVKSARDTSEPLTVEQHFTALHTLLLDMPDVEARALVYAFISKLQSKLQMADLKRTPKAGKGKPKKTAKRDVLEDA